MGPKKRRLPPPSFFSKVAEAPVQSVADALILGFSKQETPTSFIFSVLFLPRYMPTYWGEIYAVLLNASEKPILLYYLPPFQAQKQETPTSFIFSGTSLYPKNPFLIVSRLFWTFPYLKKPPPRARPRELWGACLCDLRVFALGQR